MQQFSPEEIFAAEEMSRHDFYFFCRWMFLQRRGYQWIRADHHRIICDELMRVFNGECKRLIINIPPRYSKTEIAVINFMAWALGRVPDAEFIHTSYSGRLAANNAWQARELVQSEQYRHLFPETLLRQDSSARDEWRTTAGGCVYAVGAGGTITGYGAGKHRDGFGGCFPYDQLVETEIGPIAIGDIVTKHLRVRVWSYNETAREAELKPIDTFWTNPGNDIVKVHLKNGKSFKCTPDHKVLTNSGWAQAIDLSNSLNLVNGESGFFGSLHPRFCGVDGYVYHLLRMLWLALPASIRKSIGNASPCFPGFYLTHYTRDNAVPFSYFPGSALAGEYFYNLFSGEFRPGSPFKQRKRSMLDSVLHVVGLASPCEIFESVVSAIPIEVSSFVSRVRSFTDKHLKDKRGDISQSYLSENREINAEITLPVFARFDIPQGSCSPDVSRAGNFIESKSFRDNSPLFVERFGHVDTTFCLEVGDNHNFILSQCGAIVKNCIIVDDPHKADEARSDVIRKNVIDWFQNTLESRRNSPDTPIILIMQRLHEEDLAGWLIAGGNGEEWEHICLPALREDGSALWPEKHSAEELQRMQASAPYTFSGQYQQRPSPLGGGILKGEWFRRYRVQPNFRYRKIFADTAQKTKEANDYSVFQCWGAGHDGAAYLIDQIRGKWEAPELKRRAVDFWVKHLDVDPVFFGGLRAMVIEDKSSGTGLIQDLSVTSSIPVLPVERVKDKLTRVMDIAGYVEAGRVYLPEEAPFTSGFIGECEAFTPNDSHAHDDQIDPMCDAINDMVATGNILQTWATLAD